MHKITATDPESHSADLLAANIAKLKELFPEVVAEGKVDFNALQEILGNEVESGEEYYRFTWAGKAQARREAHKPSTGTLRPCPEESVDWDNTKNLYIEGDNLEVLKLLQKSYGGKVKMIYIDPPYNTGKDFVYKDNYRDNLRNYKEQTGQVDSEGNTLSTNSDTDGRYHSNWLNMMYPRLRLARNLLRDDGVIFISIDDNEVHNIRSLCEHVFSLESFVAFLTTIVKTEGRRYGFFAKTHENIVVFCMNPDKLQLNELEVDGFEFSYSDSHGGFNLRELRNQNTRAFHSGNRPNLRYPFYADVSNVGDDGFLNLSVNPIEGHEEVWPIESAGLKSVWRWGKDKAGENTKRDLVARRGSDGVIRVYQKTRSSTQTPKTVWIGKEFISNRGTKEVQELFGGTMFDFPKPLGLLNQMLQVGTNEEDIILDFFSGSGTTAHAVMQLNAEDGSQRQHIQVQLPEPTDAKSEAYQEGYATIAEIGKERIRRAGKKILGALEAEIAALQAKKQRSEEEEQELQDKQARLSKLDIGFKVFKLDSSNIKAWDGDPERMEANLLSAAENIKPERTEADVLYEVLLKYGLDLTLPIEERTIAKRKVYNVGMGALFLCLAETITNEVAEGIGQWKEELQPETCRVIFRDNGFTDVEKTNAVQTLKRYGVTEVRSV